MSWLTSKLLMMIIPALFKSLSPVLVAQLQPLLDQLKETAQSTPNPWDDVLIAILEDIVIELVSIER